MQPVDYTTLIAVCSQLQANWLPARIEQIYQRDRYTISVGLRTLKQRGWLTLAWHPQAARVCLGDPPPRLPDTFTFSDQLRHQLKGLALTSIEPIIPLERVLELQFAKRPGEQALWYLYVEIMAKYSNVILTNGAKQIITVAHQVSANQSSFRTLQTGQTYELPPPLTTYTPSLQESFLSWKQKISLIPTDIPTQLIKTYRGLSPTLARSLVKRANLDPKATINSLSDSDWEKLFQVWQEWLNILENKNFQPGWTSDGYTVVGWNIIQPVEDLQQMLNTYYTDQLNRQVFQQKHQQLKQKIKSILDKLKVKRDKFQKKLQQSQEADQYRQQADLLMAHLQEWQPGMTTITLADFETRKPVKIALNPEKNAVQNAQYLYKIHQKLKRSREAVIPLWEETQAEINYLEQIEVNLNQLNIYTKEDDLNILQEIAEELTQQNYLSSKGERSNYTQTESQPRRYFTPSGFLVLIGRNNRQNELLTFRMASDYDLWFHSQEIPGSHVLLRLEPGSVAQKEDLQFTADLAAYYSRASESEQVPVVYTQPKYVYKPKGAKPGIAIYKKEQVIWGRPLVVKDYLNSD